MRRRAGRVYPLRPAPNPSRNDPGLALPEDCPPPTVLGKAHLSRCAIRPIYTALRRAQDLPGSPSRDT